MTNEELKISWLHCNICHRAFENHNQLNLNGDRISLIHSDLSFYFTGCGHFFCENCINAGNDEKLAIRPGGSSSNVKCRICGDQTQSFKMQSTIPEKVAVYLRPPINLLEDSLSIMMFQLNNANNLILALRSKISHQKDLLNRAKLELSTIKELKEKVRILENRESNFSNYNNPTTSNNNRSNNFNNNTSHNHNLNYLPNATRIDRNETFKIPSEFQRMRPANTNLNTNNAIPFSPNPFTPQNQRGIVYSNNPVMSSTNNSKTYNNNNNNNANYIHSNQNQNYIPPDSPVIHAQGRLSLKSPSVTSQINFTLPRRLRK